MKNLIRGYESPEMVALLLQLTRIKSDTQIDAINDHLCRGHTVENSASMNDVKEQNLCRALATLDKYAGIIEEINELKRA